MRNDAPFGSRTRTPLCLLLCLALALFLSCREESPAEPEETPAAEQQTEAIANTDLPADSEQPQDAGIPSSVRFVNAEELPGGVPAEEAFLLLALNGVVLPEAGGRTYLPVRSAEFDPRTLLSLSAGTLGEDGAFLPDPDAVILLDDTAQAGIADFLPNNLPLNVRVLSGDRAEEKSIVFTTLPVVALKRTGRKFSFTPAPAGFSLWEASEDGVRRTDSASVVKTRGNTSATLPKHGYRIELRDALDEPRKLSLLGMRRDDDWVLCASYSDNAHVRDALSWKIWEEMTANAGLSPSGTVETRYVEAIIAGEYAGFFLLMERMDAKQLGLGENDALFKSIDWTLATSAALKQAPPSAPVVISLERKHPDKPAEDWGGWKTMAEFMRLSYESDGQTFASGIEAVAEPRSMIEYWLYLNLIMGADNAYKNAYFAVIDGRVEVFPWDLDITFGLAWNGNSANNYLYQNIGHAKQSFDFQAGRRLVKYRPEWRAYALERYDALKEAGIADAEHIIGLAEGFWNELHDSGAWARNLERWPSTSKTNSLSYLNRVVRVRMQWMDGMMDDWRGE